jgi:hypothetical protein
MKSVIFIHTAIIGRYKERLNQYFNLIKSSNLYDNIETIFICCVGCQPFLFDYKDFDTNNKVQLVKVSDNLQDFELPTQQYMYNFCLTHPNYNVLYLHTKGITGEINNCIEDWVAYMIYFCINKWTNCVEHLSNYKTAGVDLVEYPTLCYCGNFWWAKSNHIATLPEPNDFCNITKYPNLLGSVRHNQEFWICYNLQKKDCICFWESNINVFKRHLVRFPSSTYTT